MASLKYYNSATKQWEAVRGGAGMPPSIYDPQGRKTDVFEYIDNKAITGGSGISISPDEPVDAKIWIDTDDGPTGEYSVVTSFKGRTGDVEPQDGDYTAEMVGAAPKGYGLGGRAVLPSSVEGATGANVGRCGFYRWDKADNAPFSYASMIACARGSDSDCFQVVFGHNQTLEGSVAMRRYVASAEKEWEYLNPLLTAGKEIRTTDRFTTNTSGSSYTPVYVKRLSTKTLAATGITNLPHEIEGLNKIIDIYGCVGNSPIIHYPGIVGISADETNLIIETSGAVAASAMIVIKYLKHS